MGSSPRPRLDFLRFRQQRQGPLSSFVHFIYLDESGDPGLKNSPTDHYILAGFSLPAADWHLINRRFSLFREWANQQYGLDHGQEIHAAEFLGAARIHCGLPRATRLLIMRKLVGMLMLSRELRFFGWVTTKQSEDPLEQTGSRCLKDLEDWRTAGFFGESRSLFIIHDQMTRQPKSWLTPGRIALIERPVAIDSRTSNLLQAADLIAYLLKQTRRPNSYLKEQGAQFLIKKLNDQALGWVDL